MRYAVIGAGNIGREVIRELLTSDSRSEIVACDRDEAALAELRTLASGRKLSVVRIEGSDVREFSQHLQGMDAMVNCTVGSHCVNILSAAIAARVAYVDVHGILFDERMALESAARRSGTTAVLGMGVSPGLTNLLAGQGVRRASGDITVDCEYVTLRPLNATRGLLETALRQFRDGAQAPVFEDGAVKGYPPFSGAISARFAGYDEDVELVYTPHSEPITIPRFIPGLKRVTVRGTYHPSIMALLKSLSAFGLLNPSARVPVGEEHVDFQPILLDALMGGGMLRPPGVRPLYLMRVRVTSEQEGRRKTSLVTIGHEPGWDPLPQGRMTALPAAYAAQLLAKREIVEPGIISPEVMCDEHVDGCLALLEKRGLWIVREMG
jgi:saccharopine dehydrogenase-like NADP-dependent oxidoreductase